MFKVTYTLNGSPATVTGHQIDYVEHTRKKVPCICVMGLTKVYIPAADVTTITLV